MVKTTAFRRISFQAVASPSLSSQSALADSSRVVGLGLPEMILLRRVLKPKLLTIFMSMVAVGIILMGYLFNLVLLKTGGDDPELLTKC